MSLMIIDRNQLRCSECDIRSSFTQFHPASLLRDPASFERFCGLWLTGGNTCLAAVQADSFLCCVSSLSSSPFPETGWLTGCLTDGASVVEPCSPGTSPGHIWPPVYIPPVSLHGVTVNVQDCNQKKKKSQECDRNNCMRVEDILSQSNVSDLLTCRHRSLWTHINMKHECTCQSLYLCTQSITMAADAVNSWFQKLFKPFFFCTISHFTKTVNKTFCLLTTLISDPSSTLRLSLPNFHHPEQWGSFTSNSQPICQKF